jgi:hypothetical protein
MDFKILVTGADVKPFGSFVSDLYSKSGDLDLSIQLWSGTNLPINKKRKQNVLREVRRALLKRGDMPLITSRIDKLCYMLHIEYIHETTISRCIR